MAFSRHMGSGNKAMKVNPYNVLWARSSVCELAFAALPSAVWGIIAPAPAASAPANNCRLEIWCLVHLLSFILTPSYFRPSLIADCDDIGPPRFSAQGPFGWAGHLVFIEWFADANKGLVTFLKGSKAERDGLRRTPTRRTLHIPVHQLVHQPATNSSEQSGTSLASFSAICRAFLNN